jgi:hypothetical protein
LGVLGEVTEILQSNNKEVVVGALELSCAMFAGGNAELQAQ